MLNNAVAPGHSAECFIKVVLIGMCSTRAKEPLLQHTRAEFCGLLSTII